MFFSTITIIKGEDFVKNPVEPPILLSKVLTFVLATALVVLAVLGFTIYKMFPLNRPQIFFLTTTIADNQDVKLIEMQPSSENLDKYKKAFVQEYIRHRNEIIMDASKMHSKWNSDNGILRTMSTDDVYSGFIKTALFNNIMGNDISNIPINCAVEFHGAPMNLNTSERNTDTYQAKFRYICIDNTGLNTQKDYIIQIKLMSQDGAKIRWMDRIENPLGLKVAEYTIISGDGDPLDATPAITQ